VSGGSYDYLCHRIDDLADHIEAHDRMNRNDLDAMRLDARVYDRENRQWITGDEAVAILASVSAEREWFVGLLRVVAKAAHDTEWVDSGDYGSGDEVAAIRACREYIRKD